MGDAFSENDMTVILAEPKVIRADITWERDEDHSSCVVFRAEIESEEGWPLFVNGNFNPLVPRVSFHLIHRQVGRIYGLDHGREHSYGDQRIGPMHKHHWTERDLDKYAYNPPDITAPRNEPAKVWEQFCDEAKLRHDGRMDKPGPVQKDLFW